MDQCWFHILQLLSIIAALPKVWILIYSTAWDGFSILDLPVAIASTYGIRQGILDTFFLSVPNMKGYDVANEAADCKAGNPNSAMLLLIDISVSISNPRSRGMIKRSPVAEAKSAFDLVYGCSFPHQSHVVVKSSAITSVNEVCVNEQKSLFGVHANRYNVSSILKCKSVTIFQGKFGGVDWQPVSCAQRHLSTLTELLVVSQHYHKRYVEDFL